MKKQILTLLVMLVFVALQACGDSATKPTATPNELIKGNWKETNTKITGKIVKGLPNSLIAQLAFPNGEIPASFLDTIKVVKELNFLNDTDVTVLPAAAGQTATKSSWKFINGTSGIEFYGLQLGAGFLGSTTTLSTSIVTLTTTNLTLNSSSPLKLTGIDVDASNFGLGKLKLDIELIIKIDMKK
jgi:hypothetical protein